MLTIKVDCGYTIHTWIRLAARAPMLELSTHFAGCGRWRSTAKHSHLDLGSRQRNRLISFSAVLLMNHAVGKPRQLQKTAQEFEDLSAFWTKTHLITKCGGQMLDPWRDMWVWSKQTPSIPERLGEICKSHFSPCLRCVRSDSTGE